MPNKSKQLEDALAVNEQLSGLLLEKEGKLKEVTEQLKALQQILDEERNRNKELKLKLDHFTELSEGGSDVIDLSDGTPFRGMDEDEAEDEKDGAIAEEDEEKEDVVAELRDTKEKGTEENTEEDEKDFKELKHSLRRRSSLTPINDLMLACTLCGLNIKLDNIESHSKKCSSKLDRQRSRNPDEKKKAEVSSLPGIVVATVTTSRRESAIGIQDLPNSIPSTGTTPKSHNVNVPGELSLKVICKTNIKSYKKPLLVAHRTMEDFIWFQKAAEQYHPQLIVPPLKFKDDLTGNIREAQRFLSRVCAHEELKRSPLTQKFFSQSRQEYELLKTNFHRKVPNRLKRQHPAVEMVDEHGLILRSQRYLMKLASNLEAVTDCVRSKRTERSGSLLGSLSESFVTLSEGEENGTYLRTASKALGDIIGDIEHKGDDIYDENVFAEDLESIKDFVQSALALLSRVEGCINTYLYWEEEVKVLEQMKMEGLVTHTNEKSIAKLWGEASSNSHTAKVELEDMGRKISHELLSFDKRKEYELKQIFIEYAETRFDVFEAIQSKWSAVKKTLNSDIDVETRAIDYSE